MSLIRRFGNWVAGFGPFGYSSRNAYARVTGSTAPRAVTIPAGSPTVVNPGDSVASKITAAGAGGTLWFTKGTHTVSSAVAPLAGQTWVLESAAGYTRTPADSAILTGADAATEQMLFIDVADLTIRGGVFEHQGAAGSGNAAAPLQTTTNAHRLLVEDAIIRDNYQGALSWGGNDCVARRVYMTNNGRIGFRSGAGQGGLLDACRISFNNTRGLDPGASGSEAGTMKVSGNTDGFTVQGCWVHDNVGFGPWADTSSGEGYRFVENVVEHNMFCGLFLENVQGGCELVRNLVRNNGYDTTGIGTVPHAFENKVQIRITGANSSLGSGIRGLVSRNIVDYDLGNQDASIGGLFLIWDHTSALPDCKNWDIKENQWWLRSATTRRIRGQDTDAASPFLWDQDIDFIDNEYHVVNTSTNFWNWDEGSGQGVAKSFAAWQVYHPGDDIAQILIAA